MPLIDPVRLLRCLSPLLDINTGAIKSEREVDKIYGLMSKYSRKLVSKCIYINILKSTPVDLLDLFMSRGGWEMLNAWLTDAINNRNYPLLQELLSLLDRVPVMVDRLKQFEIGRMVKTLSKDTSMPPPVQENARQLLAKWMAVVNLSPSAAPAAAAMPQPDSASIAPATAEIDDLTGLDLRDLNSLQFNPDTFNMALDSLGPAPIGIGGDGDGEVSDIVPVDGDPSKFDDSSTLAVIEPETLNALNDGDQQQYELNNRDGKMYIKVRANEGGASDGVDAANDATPTIAMAGTTKTDIESEASAATGTTSTTAESREKKRPPRKDPTIKKVPGGKPPMRTYEHLYEDKDRESKSKKIAATATVKESGPGDKSPPKLAAAPAPAPKGKGKPPMGPSPDTDKEKSTSKKKPSSGVGSKSTAAEVSSSSSKKASGGGSGLTKSQREAEEQRQLRIKVKEQKRVAEERRKKAEQEAQLKAQRQRDEETLKSLNLVALGAKPPQTMAKIPKRPTTTSFADAIGIPGAGEKISSSKSNTSSKKPGSEDKQKPAAAAAGTSAPGAPLGGDRQRVISHPKVKVTTKTRGQGLIEDMTKGDRDRDGFGEGQGPKTRSADSKDKDKAEKEKNKEDKDKDKDKDTTSTSIDTPPPPALKIKKKRTSSESSSATDTNEVSTKKPRLTLDDSVVMETDEDEPRTPVSTPDTPVTPPVRKIVGLQESSLFMDALTATTHSSSNRDRERRLKRRSSSTTTESPGATAAPVGASVKSPAATNNKDKVGEMSPAPTPAASKPVFNFYRETLTSEGDGDGDDAEQQPDDGGTPPGGGSTPEAQPEPDDMETETSTPVTKKPAMQIKRKPQSSPSKELKSILHVHRPGPGTGAAKLPRKSVQWVPDAELVSEFYFEMDETERVNVTKGGVLRGFGFGFGDAVAEAEAGAGADNDVRSQAAAMAKPKNFAEMKLLEKAQEKKLVKRRGLFGAIDIMEEKIEWSKPKKIDLEGLVQECVVQSDQVAVQEEREKGTLQVFYFTKHDIPDSPDESLALVEQFDLAGAGAGPVTVIPCEDVPGVTKVTQVKTPEDQQRAVQQHLLLQQQQEAAAALQQQFGGAVLNLWGTGAAGIGSASAGTTVPPNPFAIAMALAAANINANTAATANGGLGLDSAAAAAAWGAQAQSFGQQQQPPSLLQSHFTNPYGQGQGANQNQGYDDYVGSSDQQASFRNHGGGRGGRGGGRRQFSRFDNSGGGGGGRNQHGGGGRDWDDRQGGGGDRRNNRMGNQNQHQFRDGGQGGREFRGGRGAHNDGGPPKRERGRVGRTVLCKFFAQGTCKAGPGCDFLHPGINGPHRGGRFNNPGGGGGGMNEWQQARGPPRRRDGGDEGYSKDYQNEDQQQQDTSPASPEPEFGDNANSDHRPIEFRDGES